MDLSKLTRNKDKVRANLVKLDDNSVVAKGGCKIYIPGRYVNKGLAGIGDTIWTVGIFTIVTDSGFYCTALGPATITLDPTDIRQVKVDGNPYYEFSFEPGATVIQSTIVGKNDRLIGPLFNEFLINGNVPYGFNLLDLIKLFKLSQKYCGFTMGTNNQIFEAIVNIVARDSKDLNKLYRYTVNSLDEIYTNPPTIIGLRNAAKTSTNTVAKLVGSYFADGLVSALINPSDRVEGVEEILRK
ncbi:hypothetical protein RAY_168 [Erwinia phage vB_EamM_RAY]|jgi:hypothetical protein|uniref:Uncharacterized protein n=9 Tax=Agricanvirus TaxID=1984776 RepID=A0A173GEV1_9CAUD|nr:virion structural protein [Erwinia phage Ea35-70]YP_009605317.1 virion structural protein [Erwinia phage vB_EamM_Deimos-Minion]YP_009605635.1 virion structural protein [Erwinia phage vB_EamM_RAY]YP_009605955.1 virion structural protein [Erwinia phage vB_EamM_Simmy50]YP_009606276.1 virion structural protein [Erwinia phage vB_EamM_Special G]AUG85957.1 hypothetical protein BOSOLAPHORUS_170 [Erwinia phage vB_EamM_Bosolaphorus]AUG86598.1 hypothetical protein MADMEL_170 [Erwinia phage vB_EamM_Ma